MNLLLPQLDVHELDRQIVFENCRCLQELRQAYPINIQILWEACNRLLILACNTEDIKMSEANQLNADASKTMTLGLSSSSWQASALSKWLPGSKQLCVSLKAIELSQLVTGTVERLSILLGCLESLVSVSKQLIASGSQSAIYQLFTQPWFVNLWTQEYGTFREELLACLVEVCLVARSLSDDWLTIAMEVVDVCGKVLDWPCFTPDRVFAASYYFSLLEQVCLDVAELSQKSCSDKFEGRLQQCLEDLVAREISDTPLKPNTEYASSMAIKLLSEYWQPLNEESLIKLGNSVCTTLLQEDFLTKLTQQSSLVIKKSGESLLLSCLHFSMRFSQHVGSHIAQQLSHFCSIISTETRAESLFTLGQRILTMIVHRQQGEAVFGDEFSLMIERKSSEEAISSNLHECLHSALHLYGTSSCRQVSSSKPMALLRYSQPLAEMNWRCKELKALTGFADPLQILVTHVLYASE